MIGVAARGGRPAPWTRLAWRHPEWWAVALAAAAWLLIAFGVLHRAGGHEAAHHHHPGMAEMPSPAPAFAWAGEGLAWAVMIVAMMVPLVLAPIVTTATRSLWRRRHRAVAGFLAGYLGLWIAGGAAALGVIAVAGIGDRLRDPVVVAAGFILAAGWQLAPLRRRALMACHRTMPLAPRGWRADRDCVVYGWEIGRRCIVTCWPAMLACVLAGHSLPVMGGIGAIALAERMRPRPNQRLFAGLLLALGVAWLLAKQLG